MSDKRTEDRPRYFASGSATSQLSLTRESYSVNFEQNWLVFNTGVTFLGTLVNIRSSQALYRSEA